ncbi:MAG: ExbD/TolR family protein [Gammaproteobacteria bacterium]
MKLVRRKYIQETVELNITAFLNLMVILIPFLLITAVFSRITVLELNLPAKDAIAKQEEKIKLQLELVIRQHSFEVRDSNIGRIKYIERNEAKPNWKLFTDILLEIKRRFPEEQSITLLLEPAINYKTLIQVMDRVRSADVVQFTEVQNLELFPEISIGDAPVLEETSAVSVTDVLSSKDASTEAAGAKKVIAE